MKFINRIRLTVTATMLALILGVFGFAAEVFAQAATPVPLSGSNPQALGPTDVPVDWSLFWVFMFFFVLCIGLFFANWLVRRGTFDNSNQ